MFRSMVVSSVLASAAWVTQASADIVTDWNKTLYEVIQSDGTRIDHKANPGWSTRSIAMMNGAIYDAFQAVERQYTPFRYTPLAPANTSVAAAVNQAAYELLLECYPQESDILLQDYNARMHPSVVPDGEAKSNGIALGQAIAEHYSQWRQNDGADESIQYTPPTGLGLWAPDPYWPGLLEDPPRPQEAWGPGWRNVKTFGIPHADVPSFIAQLPSLPSLDSVEYAAAYNQVKEYGALQSALRDDEDTAVALFWAYDRPSMGPPPALFIRNLWEIAEVVPRTAADNARLFAQASVAMADAAVAAWDAKFEYNFWRPVTAIHQGDADGNPGTVGDPNWRPLGAPGSSHGDFSDDFTPPFPAWTSGHATMGAAVFKSLALFYEENEFAALMGEAPGTTFTLTSEEAGSGGSRSFTHFHHTGPLDVDSYLGSPDGENAISRIFLGIHWIMDQRDGMQLGHTIADYVYANYFHAVPEPGALALSLTAALGLAGARRRA